MNSTAFAPPDTALSLYRGPVMHARMKPVVHRFTYHVFSILIDLDRIAEAGRSSAFFSTDRWNLISFCQKDHGPRDGSQLRTYIDTVLSKAGLVRAHRILLMCYPRILGFTFNPLAIYYCYDEADDLCALVYEVRNTFGEAHTYVAPIVAGEKKADTVRQERDKLFYVSPFLDMDMRYHFRLQPPGDELKVRILETDATGPILAATFNGRRLAPTTRNILALFFAMPLLTFKVVAAIHWEALRLYVKGLRIKTRPSPPSSLSFPHSHPNTMPDARL